MLRHVLTGLVLLIAIPMQLKAADGPSPGLARTVEQVFDPDTGTANAVGEVTKVAAVSGIPVYQVIAVMGAQAGTRELARVGVTAQTGTTIINNFAPTQPSRGLATTPGTGTESEDSFSVSNTSGTKSGGVGKSGVINGGGNGGAQFVAAGSDGVGVGSNNPGDTSVAVTESLQAYTQSFLDSLSGFKASDFSNFAANFAGVTAKFEPSASTFKAIQSQRTAEPVSGFTGPSLGTGFSDAATKPQQVAALSPAQKDPVPADRLAFNQVFLPTPPSPTATPTTTPTTPATAVAAKPVEKKTTVPVAPVTTTTPTTSPVLTAKGVRSETTTAPSGPTGPADSSTKFGNSTPGQDCISACKKLNGLGIEVAAGQWNVVNQPFTLIAKPLGIRAKSQETRIKEAHAMLKACSGSSNNFSSIGDITGAQFSLKLLDSSKCRPFFVGELAQTRAESFGPYLNPLSRHLSGKPDSFEAVVPKADSSPPPTAITPQPIPAPPRPAAE